MEAMGTAVATTTVEQALLEAAVPLFLLTPHERAGGWRRAFGEVAPRVPEPYPLFTEDEQTAVGPGWPLLASPAWERVTREWAAVMNADAAYRLAVAAGQRPDKRGLVEQRHALVALLAELIENAILHDHGQRLPEILWLVLSRQVAEGVRLALRAAKVESWDAIPVEPAQLRYALAEVQVDLLHRAESEALARLRRQADYDPPPEVLALGRQMREDMLPFFLDVPTGKLSDLDPYLRLRLTLEPGRFHTGLATTAGWLEELRQEDLAFARTLSLVVPDAVHCSSLQLVFVPQVLELLEAWEDRNAHKLPADTRSTVETLGARLKRFEVLAALRSRLAPVAVRGNALVATWKGDAVRLSASIRPLDFTSPGVVESTVRRYGLLYDLVEFTQILEELRRRGRSVEDRAMRFMVRFQARVDAIRRRHRLRFEKFLGDGAFFSARRPSAVLFAAAELRLLYEDLRRQGFPFDRGLRLAVNVGTYHLFPLPSATGSGPHFEFLGHGLVELARLTTGKTTQEVEDIEDFLIASGYDVHRVLEFLEPVRHARRSPDHVRERSYAAFLAENQELVNLGGVATEGFLRELEADLADVRLHRTERWGLSWVLVPLPATSGTAPRVALRLLGTARLKGLEPTPLAEMAVFEEPDPGEQPLPPQTSLLEALQRLAGREGQEGTAEGEATGAVDPHLCVVSAIEPPDTRAWFIGLFHEEVDALFHTFRVPLKGVDVKDGEPFEAWLYRQRFELAKLYRGLRRGGQGATLSLADLRGRDGYFACLLQAPHRSPR